MIFVIISFSGTKKNHKIVLKDILFKIIVNDLFFIHFNFLKFMTVQEQEFIAKMV